MKTKYVVVIPWFGVEKGLTFETEYLNPAFRANVRRADGAEEPGDIELVPAVKPRSGKKGKKGKEEPAAPDSTEEDAMRTRITGKLDELGITYEASSDTQTLAAALPSEVLQQLLAE